MASHHRFASVARQEDTPHSDSSTGTMPPGLHTRQCTLASWLLVCVALWHCHGAAIRRDASPGAACSGQPSGRMASQRLARWAQIPGRTWWMFHPRAAVRRAQCARARRSAAQRQPRQGRAASLRHLVRPEAQTSRAVEGRATFQGGGARCRLRRLQLCGSYSPGCAVAWLP